jgi:hypothetical protein
MIRSILLLVTLLLTLHNTSYCQPSRTKKADYSNDGKNKFPFNTSATVLLISFSVPEEIIEPAIIGDTKPPKVVTKNERFRDTLGHKEVREIVQLPQKEIEDLHGVLNKLVCKGPLKMRSCYSPRNAVLFMNKNGKVVAELEVCFECLRFETKPQHFYVRDVRECMYDALKKIFADAGVKYGIEPEK